MTTRDLLGRRADLALGDAEKDAWCAKWGRWHNGRLIFPQMIDGKTVYDLTD
ncbi:hypothetical protein [Pseudogemmobacter faecipullorum]|uniref:Uncharacterized protein n=1 Tax=Pseudogemmobacter faecipullorum TaxID=2755041 RepID=A0ABS8CQY9_9RHOB|nr:hypothetical protein [Pseudogemmobacter faecipullorum]MCB5411812.1 hypothetical protein [Pseudogemmobacter faecipullorum]